jgi:hypothetical protein
LWQCSARGAIRLLPTKLIHKHNPQTTALHALWFLKTCHIFFSWRWYMNKRTYRRKLSNVCTN